ncbi:Ubiquitin carboxyl-terminal hydrolase 34 [Phytophthora boehmeriae]|uniref:Ubiquitin carboxyl-terminal hydrolase 34 n=1 Tax=Phytophthora boehmeriae TaxID=109152 RepID=A0A8T1WM50_9STRA|nr:Ubiquitin carboxyl-terminal hydrolase 34 [Phytophthora boehmeriae]
MAAELREGAAHVAQELQRDFEETCLAIASDLAASDDPTRLLELVMTLCDKATFGLTAELQQRLDREFLPQVVQLLLTKSFDLRAVEGVNTFFQWTLATIASRVQQRDVCHLLCLTRILEAHRRFYLYHGKSGDKNSLTQLGEKNPNWEFALRDKIGYTSRYFVLNLEYWGQVGGFALFLDLLHHQNTTFEQLQLVLRTMYAVKDYVSPPFLGGYFPKLVDSVSDFVQNVPSAEFHKLSRDSLMEVVQIAELLLVKVQHDFDAFGGQNLLLRQLCEQRVQLLRLEISLRFFRASQLEKRIYGLTEIVVVVTRLYNDQIQLQPEPTATSLFATLSFLVDWMHEKQLVQELFGHKMHVELVKRSTSLFQFVSELECLPTEWLDLLWSCYHAETESGAQAVETQPLRPTQQRHEAFRGTIHDLMLEMVEFMELPSLNHVLSRIEAVQANLDANQLGLLSAIAARKIFLEEGTPPAKLSLRQRILTHLWTAVLPSVKTEDFRDEILLRMHEMLRLEVEIDEVRPVLMGRKKNRLSC